MKDLFIPLKAEWFEKFRSDEKTVEYRAYGPRWNEKTCIIGRKAILAYGYGWPRLRMYVRSFKKLPRDKAPAVAREIFPNAKFIAAIGLRFP